MINSSIVDSSSFLQPQNPAFKSPSKMFRRLKSKSQLDLSMNLNQMQINDVQYVFRRPKKKPESCCLSEKIKENQIETSSCNEGRTFTVSLLDSEKSFYLSEIGSKTLEETFLQSERGQGDRLESTKLSQPLSLLNGRQFVRRTRSKVNIRSSVASNEQLVVNPPSKIYSPGNVFSPTRRKFKTQSDRQEFKNRESTKENNRELQNSTESLNLDCSIILERMTLDSPVKEVGCQKENKPRRDRRRDAIETNPVHCTAHSDDEIEDDVSFRGSEKTVNQNRSRSNLFRPDVNSSEETSTAVPQPIQLLEDPIVLNSPVVTIPKPNGIVVKRRRWPKQQKFPQENVVHLKKWLLRKTSKGLFVCGIHKEENIPWNSNIIVERISETVLKTITGKIYILIGKMKVDAHCDFPKWLLKRFVKGFPQNWKKIFEQHLRDLREQPKIVPAPTKTPECSSPASIFSTYVSRSGRIIKPPLEYWKGARVSLDLSMNVTFHGSYSNHQSDSTSTAPSLASQTPICESIPSSKERKSTQKEQRICRQAKPSIKSKQSSKTEKHKKNRSGTTQDEDEWTKAELEALQKAVSFYPKYELGYWMKVAKMVGTRSAEECHKQHTSLGISNSPKKNKQKPPQIIPSEKPVVSARVGTLKRKQQVREFLKAQPKNDIDDAFSSAYMQEQQYEIPSLCQSLEVSFEMSEPTTPKFPNYPEAKTPQCQSITPRKLGSPNTYTDDQVVYQLQKKLKKNQINFFNYSPVTTRYTKSPVMQQLRKLQTTENEAFEIWEMPAENAEDAFDSEEEQDFYFTNN